MKTHFAAIFLGFFFSVTLLGSSSNSKENMEITKWNSEQTRQFFFDNLNRTAKCDYKFVGYYPETKKIHGVLYHKIMPEKKEYLRLNSYAQNGKELVYIIQGDQIYMLYKDIIFHLKWNEDFESGQINAIGKTFSIVKDIDEKVTCRYLITEDKFGKDECYKVTMEIPHEDKDIKAIFRVKSDSEFLEKKEQLMSQIPVKAVAYFYKDTKYLCSVTLFSLLGRKLGTLDLSQGNFERNINIPDSVFQLPEKKIIVIRNQRELKENYEKYILKDK